MGEFNSSYYIMTNEALSLLKKKVLLLNSYRKGDMRAAHTTDIIKTELTTRELDIDIYIEHIDTKHHKLNNVKGLLERLYKERYANTQFDVIILSDKNLLIPLLKHRENLCPSVPIIFYGMRDFDYTLIETHELIIGITEDSDISETIDVVLRLHPKTMHIALIIDSSQTGRLRQNRFRSIARRFEGMVNFIELVEWDGPELKEKLAHLPKNTVIITLALYLDRAGSYYSHIERQAFTKEINVPHYTMWDTDLWNGYVGGWIMSNTSHITHAARIALRILQGEPAERIPQLCTAPSVPMFDYIQMKRFGIKENKLPKESIVLNKTPSTGMMSCCHGIWFIIIALCVLTFIIIAF
ncbi:MAG: ABC transporter substrate-binding protein [bacterium]